LAGAYQGGAVAHASACRGELQFAGAELSAEADSSTLKRAPRHMAGILIGRVPMPERLRRADFRFLAICLLLLAATVWFSARYFYRAFPEASIDFRVTREQARAQAERFLAGQGLPVNGYRQASRFSYDDTAKTFLERELGLDRANRIMRGRVRLWRWSWRWFRPYKRRSSA